MLQAYPRVCQTATANGTEGRAQFWYMLVGLFDSSLHTAALHSLNICAHPRRSLNSQTRRRATLLKRTQVQRYTTASTRSIPPLLLNKLPWSREVLLVHPLPPRVLNNDASPCASTIRSRRRNGVGPRWTRTLGASSVGLQRERAHV